ncbi:MAG: DUF4232 domain-containing protein [Actinomycetota bacterium]|nr:DUF4232 domain-containing protein [Actinomycetota bacterium]
MRYSVAALVVTGLVALCGLGASLAAVESAPTSSGPLSPAVSPHPICEASQLSVEFVQSGVAMGSYTEKLSLVNSGATCRMKGVPSVQLVTAASADLPTTETARTTPKSTEPDVVLHSGTSADFTIQFEDGTGFTGDSCPTSSSLRITPPEQSGTVMYGDKGANINGYGGDALTFRCGVISVSAVEESPTEGSSFTRSGTLPTPNALFPHVVGDTLEEAQWAVDATKLLTRVRASSIVVDPTVPPETIISQSGTHLTVAVPADTPCRQTQLAATYQFNQGSLGSLFAGLDVRNLSPAWCSIAGSFELAGLSKTGVRVTNTASLPLSNPTIDVLSPSTPPLPKTTSWTGAGTGTDYPVDVFWLYVGFSGPSNTCTPDLPGSSVKHVAPATWRLTFPEGFSLTATNGTRTTATHPPSGTPNYRSSAARRQRIGGNVALSREYDC